MSAAGAPPPLAGRAEWPGWAPGAPRGGLSLLGPPSCGRLRRRGLAGLLAQTSLSICLGLPAWTQLLSSCWNTRPGGLLDPD